MSEEREIHDFEIGGRKVSVDAALGHLWVEHDGAITWDELQDIKNRVWGHDARAIEVYPAFRNVVNNANIRHLWRLGAGDFCPDLLGCQPGDDSLEARWAHAWKGV